MKQALICATCGKEYRREHTQRPSRFCSRACQVASWEKPKVEKLCQHCGLTFQVHAYRAKSAKFCSFACRARALSVGITIAIPNPNRATPKRHYENWRYVKAATATRKRDNYRCQDCGRQFKPRQYGLDVHHVVPVADGGPDTLDNLISLCRSCHSKRDNRYRNFKRAAP